MPGIFLSVKFQAYVFFCVRNKKLRRTPPSCILQVPPWALNPHLRRLKEFSTAVQFSIKFPLFFHLPPALTFTLKLLVFVIDYNPSFNV